MKKLMSGINWMIFYQHGKILKILLMSLKKNKFYRDTLVMKFGGDSLSSSGKIKKAALIVKKRKKEFSKIVVVVSAMGDMTDKLLKLSKKISISPQKREQDMLISVGERISMSLLAMALFEKGISAISFTGSQAGIITTDEHFNAKIVDVRPKRILDNVDENVVIVAGFQGVSDKNNITTLGRGGSDITAVALGVCLKSFMVEFYKDVEGIYSLDPKKYLYAEKIKKMSYKKALKMAKDDDFVLHKRAIKLAENNNVVLKVLSYRDVGEGTLINDKKRNVDKIFYEKVLEI